jgi:WD40 repeat protein
MILARDGGELASYDITSGRSLWSLSTSSGNLTSCTYNRDGTKVVVGSDMGVVYVYDSSGHPVAGPIQFSDTAVLRVLCPKDVDELIVALQDGRLVKWNCKAGQSTWQINAHDQGVNDVAFDAKEDAVWSAGDDGTVVSWSFESGQRLTEIANGPRRIRSLAIASGTDTILAGYTWDCTLLLWNPSIPGACLTYDTGNEGGCRVRFSDGSAMVAVASNEHGVKLFNTQAFLPQLLDP